MILSNYWKVFTTGKQFCLQYHLHDGILIWTLVLCFKDCVLCHKGMKLHPGWGHKLLNRNSPWEDINLVNINLNFIRDIFVIFFVFFFVRQYSLISYTMLLLESGNIPFTLGSSWLCFQRSLEMNAIFFFNNRKKS